MLTFSTSGDYRPVTWIKRFPVYVTTILCALCVLGMFAMAFLSSARVDLSPLAFSTDRFWRGWLWQPVTSLFLDGPSFFFVFGILFLYMSGIEVEKYLGRPRYLLLLGLFAAVPVVVLSMWCLFLGFPLTGAGSRELMIGMFIAFASLYPGIEMFGFVPLKWLAFACLTLASMQHLPSHDWVGMSVLWTMAGAAFGYVRFLQHDGPSSVRFFFQRRFGRSRQLRVLPSPNRVPRRTVSDDTVESIDPLLDKIARHGLGSLTSRDRARLERARLALLKKKD